MKILVPTADYPPIEGGISTVTVQLTRALAAMGHQVTVLAPYFARMDDFDRAEPVRVIRYRGYRLGWLRVIPMLIKCWRAETPAPPSANAEQASVPATRLPQGADLILAINISSGGLIGYLGYRCCKVPYFTLAYAYEFLKFRRNSLFAALYRQIYSHSRRVIAISRFTRDNLVKFGVDEQRIEVILPGATAVDTVNQKTVEEIRKRYALESNRVILSVARFIKRKNHITLIRALPSILNRCPDCLLVLVGRGPTMRECLLESVKLGVRENIIFPGVVPGADVAALYEACDVFALPTGEDDGAHAGAGNVEGFGLVFAEANAHGKPAVAGRSGGTIDAVIDGETGFLVDPTDPNQLADAIIKLLEDPLLAGRMGESGRRRIETELNWQHFAEEIMKKMDEK